MTTLIAACGAIPVLSGCGDDPKPTPAEFTFSVDIETGKNELEIGSRDKIVVYENKDPSDNTARNYIYTSSNPSVASINEYGVITAKAVGEVIFQVKEEASGETAKLVNPIKVIEQTEPASGGFNYAAQAGEAALKTRSEILGSLEKYAMDSHLTGITLFDNGGYVKYHSRVKLPTTNYITGYGFGLLREGYLDGPLPSETTEKYKDYYHASISQDSQTINAMNASGSQVSDLSSYITSSYWGTKMAGNKTEYEWYPVLAAETVRKPIIGDDGKISGYEASETPNKRPIRMEKKNDLDLYKRWRIYLRDGIQYRYTGTKGAFDRRDVALEDYEFVYQFLLTGKNGQSRGAEMAGDTTYGIKGAQTFYNATLKQEDQSVIDDLWQKMKESGDLGIQTGVDDNGKKYIELELVNAIDEFTAMYTLSSSLVSPLPRDFMLAIGDGSIINAGQRYGNFNDGDIKDYTLNVGPYMLEAWNKKQLIAFARNDDWFEVKLPDTYRIKGIHNRVIDTSQDTEATFKQFQDGALDVTGIPTTKIETESQTALKTKGDSTFKLNVNSCTQSEWDELFGKNGKINKNSKWTVKPWMSNNNFLNGLFFSINRAEFARKRGVQPSINYFSDAYLSNPEKGESYNDTDAHKAAVAAYHTVKYDETGKETYNDYGYNYDKAVNSFKAAVNQLAQSGAIVKGPDKDNPTVIDIDIAWMYQTDPTEYGEDIKSYFEKAFNDPAVSNGTVKLNVTNSTVTNWEDVYNERMMKGQFDLGFGAISGNTYNPLNFLEVLKSDNSSGFTLNWGTDTSKVDDVHPINYKGKKWSFDGLWEVADHGGIVQDGVKIKPIVSCYQSTPHQIISGSVTGKEVNDLSGINENGVAIDPNYDGYEIRIPLEFVQTEGVKLSFSKLKIYASGMGFEEIPATDVSYNGKEIIAKISKAICDKIDKGMFSALYDGKDIDFTKAENKWKQHPFRQDKYDNLWNYEVYYNMELAGGQPSENSVSAKINKQAKDD